MPGYLRQSTASQSRALGPFVDDTDFKTAETGLTIANTDIKLVVNGGASANKNSGGGTHRVNGVYGVTFDATDTATVGEMEVSVVVAGALPVFDKFFVLEEAVYDALFASSAPGYLQPTTAGRTLDVSAGGEAGIDWANIGSPSTTQGLSGTTVKTATDVETDTQDIQSRLPAALTGGGNMKADMLAVSGDTTAADNVEADYDGTGYNKSASTIGTATNLTNAPPDSAGVTTLLSRIPSTLFSGITSLAQWLGLIAGKQTGNTTARNELRGTGAGSGTYDETTDSQEALRDRGDAAWTTATGFSTHSAADVWAVGTRTLTSFGTLVSDIWAAVVDSAGVTTLLSRLSATRAGYLDNLSAGAVALQSTLTSVSDRIGAFTGSGVNTVLGFFKALLSKTASTPSDVGGTFDPATDATEAIRDRGDAAWTTATGFSTHTAADVWAVGTRTLTSFGTLVADVATAVWGAATRILTAGTNIVLAKGTGVTGFNDLDAAGVRSAVGLASANLDTQLDALPTAAETADKILLRNLASGSDGGRTVQDALRFNRNKFTIAGGTLTVYEEDDVTVAWTATITQTPGDPVSASDPA